MAGKSAADTPAALGLVGLFLLLFLFPVLFLLLPALLLLFLLPGGSLLCGLQGFFQVAGRLDGLALGIDATCTSFSTAGLTRPSSSAAL